MAHKAFPTTLDIGGEGKDLFEQRLALWKKQTGPNFVISGLTVPGDSVDLTLEVASGESQISGYRIQNDAVVVNCVDNDTNSIYINLTRDGDNNIDGVVFTVNTTGTPPSDDSILVAIAITIGGIVDSTLDARLLSSLGSNSFAIPTIVLSNGFVEGSSLKAIRSDATIKVFDDISPVNSVNGDSSVSGSNLFAARSDHKHGLASLPGFGVPNLGFGTSNADGVASNYLRIDATLAIFDITNPVIQAFSDSPATGSAAFAARRDHVHGMPAAPASLSFATPSLTLGTANAAGAAGTVIRSDATILAFDVTVPVTQAFADAAATGSVAVAARRDHKHGMPSFATNAVLLGTAAAAGASTTPMRSNDTIAAFDVTVPTTSAVGDAAATGSVAFAARRDHVHGREAFATNTFAFSTATAAGAATTLIRSDATLAIFDATTPSTQAIGDTGTVGVAAFAARRDHKHVMPTFVTNTMILGSAAAAGVATTLIRSDATIAAFDATSPSTQAIGDAAAVGTAAFAARRDHKHAMPAFATNAIILGSAAAAGAATTVIRSNDTIAAFDVTSPTTSAVGDAAAVGSVAFAARRDHVHGREAFATNTFAFSTATAAGAATTLVRSDATLAIFDATVPVTQASADAAATGSAAFAARRDHKHGMPTLGSTPYDYMSVNQFSFYDEFITGISSTAVINYKYNFSPGGSASGVDSNGQTYIILGGSTTALAVLYLATIVAVGGSNFSFKNTQNPSFKGVINQAQASSGGTVESILGLLIKSAYTTTGQQDGIHFRSVNNANWFLVSRSGGTETTVDMGIAPSTTIICLEFVVSSSGTSIQGYVNGVSTGVAITTNIPTALLIPVCRVNNRAATVTTTVNLSLYAWAWKGTLRT